MICKYCLLLMMAILNICGNVRAQSLKDLEDSVNLYYGQGMYVKAKIFADKGVEQAKLLGQQNIDYATAFSNLASVYQAMSNLRAADSLFRYLLPIQQKLTGEISEEYGIALLNMAHLCSEMGKNTDALNYNFKALNIYKAIKIEDDNFLIILNNIGLVYQNMQQYSLAKKYYLNVIEACNKKPFDSIPSLYTSTLNNLGSLAYYLGNYNDAEKYLQDAIEIKRKSVPQNIPDIAKSVSNLANVLVKLENYKAAELLIKQALEIRKNTLTEYHIDYAVSLNILANILNAQKKFSTADSSYQRSLQIIKQIGTEEEHPNYLGALTNLAIFKGQIKQFKVADTLFNQAAVICKRSAGDTSLQYALIQRSKGRMYYFMADYNTAEPLLLQSLAITKKVLGETHPEYVTTMAYLCNLYNARQQYQQAAIYSISVVENEKNLLFNKLDFLSQLELLPYIKERQASFATPYQLLWHVHQPQLASTAYNSRLMLNGIGIQNAKSMSNQMLQSSDSILASLSKKYSENQLLLNKTLATAIKKRTLNTDSLSQLTNQQEKELLRKFAPYRDMKAKLNTTWQDVRNNLKANEAAIEFVCFNKLKPKISGPDTIYYAALLLRPQDTIPVFIKLFEEGQLKAALKNFAFTAYVANPVTNNTTKQIPSKANLFKALWQPLEPYLSKTTTIYFAPDGLLHQVAFAAIPNAKGVLLCDTYNLIQVTSTRQVAIIDNSEQAVPSSIALFGGINYNGQTTDSTITATPDPYSYAYQQNRAATLDSFNYLPNTLVEVTSIKKDMQQKQKVATLFSGDKATEAAFRAMAGKASSPIIHFATHGFTLPFAANQTNSSNTFKISDNPLLRSGLVMAGGNKGWKNKSATDEDDGILTALEISSVSLPNTQLAVLSACETGLGELRGSEGVFGLQRAFKLAGVNYVMASLWQVPDAATKEFMQTFYTNWLSGTTIQKAFLTTQQTMRKKYAPYYWAGFTLVQ